MKKPLLFLAIILFVKFAFAQTSTETFETETSGSTTFNDNGQSFSVTSQLRGPFDIQTSYPGTGWNGSAADNRYIDNDGFATASGSEFTINSSTSFIVNNFYLYLGNSSADVNTTGTVLLLVN